MAVVAIEHIDIDESGIARIAGKRTKVIHLVMDKIANQWGPDELHRQYPHLSLAEIHSAFAYYYDHQAELDCEINEDRTLAEELAANADPSPIAEKLRELGKIP